MCAFHSNRIELWEPLSRTPGRSGGHVPRTWDGEKQAWKPGTLLNPVPAVMVSCGELQGIRNIITVAWAGTVCSDPPMVSISVRPERYSYDIIRKSGEFVINLPTDTMAKLVDFCGVYSGRDLGRLGFKAPKGAEGPMDKFLATGLHAAAAVHLKAPVIEECPVNLECRVKKTMPLGSHVLFLAEVVGVNVASSLVDRQGRLQLERAHLLSYAHGEYFSMGRILGHFGFSTEPHPSSGKSPRGGRK